MIVIYDDLDKIPKGIKFIKDNDLFFNGATPLEDDAVFKKILFK